MNRINLPGFLFVGTAKAGTTSLYHFLSQHEQVSIPVKETFYFLRDLYESNTLSYPQQRKADTYILDQEAYQRIYAPIPPQQLTGEVGTGYLYHYDLAIPRIIEELGTEVRIVIVLREPVSRCYSAYMHFVKDLHEPLSFEEALQAEHRRKELKWDFMWHYKSLGCYAAQVEAYMQSFKHVKVLIYEEVVQDFERSCNELFQFLGLPVLGEFKPLPTLNPSGVPRYPFLQKLITHENVFKSLIRPALRAVLPRQKREQMRKSLKSKNLVRGAAMPPSSAQMLTEYYAEDIRKLELLLNRKIAAWRR